MVTSKEWRITHPIRWRRFQKKYRLEHKKTLHCRECNKVVTNRGKGRIFCSHKCQYTRFLRRHKSYRDKMQQKFYRYKERIGCRICGYKKFGGALDFHHKNPLTKERRITAIHFACKTKVVIDEIKKCILLCSNCHREQHFKEKSNGTI